MAKDVYEKHILQNPHLPFLFNTQCIERGTVYSHWHENIEIISCIDGEARFFPIPNRFRLRREIQ